MIYTEKDIKLGTKMICKNNGDIGWWKTNKVYEVVESKISKEIICVIDECGAERYIEGILSRLNGVSSVEFELIKEEKMKKLKLGDKVICTRDARKRWWKKGKIYEVVKSKNTGKLVVLDEEEDEREIRIVEHYLNSDTMLNFELYKEENNMQDFKVGDLVEVIVNNSNTYKNKTDLYQPGDKAIITEVYGFNVRIGDPRYGNIISKNEIKKVEPILDLTEYEEELVLRLAECIKCKDKYLSQIQQFKNNIKFNENELEKVSKEIKEIIKKLLTK